MRLVRPEVMASMAWGEPKTCERTSRAGTITTACELFGGNDHLGGGQAVQHRDLAKVLAFFNKVKAYFTAVQRKVLMACGRPSQQKHSGWLDGLVFGQHHLPLGKSVRAGVITQLGQCLCRKQTHQG